MHIQCIPFMFHEYIGKLPSLFSDFTKLFTSSQGAARVLLFAFLVVSAPLCKAQVRYYRNSMLVSLGMPGVFGNLGDMHSPRSLLDQVLIILRNIAARSA